MSKFLKKYDLEIHERRDITVNEFDEFIDTLTENDGTMSAICASDLNFVRTMYELTAAEKIRAEDLETLRNGLRALSAAPHDAFVIVLYIPQNVLKKIAQDVGLGRKFALIGAVESSGFAAVIGCYKTIESALQKKA